MRCGSRKGTKAGAPWAPPVYYAPGRPFRPGPITGVTPATAGGRSPDPECPGVGVRVLHDEAHLIDFELNELSLRSVLAGIQRHRTDLGLGVPEAPGARAARTRCHSVDDQPDLRRPACRYAVKLRAARIHFANVSCDGVVSAVPGSPVTASARSRSAAASWSAMASTEATPRRLSSDM